MSAEYYLEQAEALRLERHRLEKYDLFFQYIGISFEKNRINNIIYNYAKAGEMFADAKHWIKSSDCFIEAAVLSCYIKDPNKGAIYYVSAALHAWRGNNYNKCIYACEQANALKQLLTLQIKVQMSVEIQYIMACLAYEEGDDERVVAYLENAIRESVKYGEQNKIYVIKVYEKLVYLYVMKQNKPALAITMCDEIIRRSKVHREFYSKLKTKLMEKQMGESQNLLQELVQ
jgi:hypothetical protein